MRATAAGVETITGPLIAEGKEFLKKEVSFEEVRKEVMKIRDSAPGVEGIRALAIKSLDEDGGTRKPDDWPSEMKEGWLIPLHEKGPKLDLNNYRGVCLLPLAARVIAREYATRLRTWAEKTDALGENQCGLRRDRSTADSTQNILKVD